jgi:outer membrane receptor for ferrienterochelin and colicin
MSEPGYARRAFFFLVCLTALPLCGFATPATAQLQLGTISGTVIGPDGELVEGAVVTLLDGLGDSVVSVPAPNGQFRFNNVSPGTYSLQAEAQPLRAVLQTLTVAGALPVHVELRATPVVAEQVVVRGEEINPTPTTTRVTLAGEAVRRSPMRLRSRGIQDAIATTPGWGTEDNGLLHVRGVDDGILYVVDGVPVYERLDGLFGVAPDPAMIESLNVLTGYIPPEFGYKSGGVIEVRSGSHPADRWLAALDAVGGSHATREFSTIAGGPVGRTLAATLGVSGQGSSRFLDPVHPDNLHNDGHAVSGGGEIAWSVSPRNIVTGVVGFGRSNFDVPHGVEQEEAGQDQRQRLRQSWQTVSWQRSWSDSVVSQVAGYHRRGSSALIGSANDVPLFTNADRALRRIGMLASVTHQRGRHLVKLGAEAARLSLSEYFTFAVTDDAEAEEAGLSGAARAFTLGQPFVFDDRATPSLVSFYIQDSIRASDQLTIDLGVRGDRSRLLAETSQWSPRIGASYHWASTETIVRGSFARFFQPPQPENLLLASSEQARELSPFVGATGGGADLFPERQTAVELAVAQNFARLVRLDISYWQRRVRDAGDPNVFFGTTIIFPNTVARGRAAGLDVRLEMPRRRGWSGFVSYSNSRVVQFGPVTGGLFLEDDIGEIGEGTAFTPDHDQRNVGAAGVTYDHEPSGFWLSLGGRYESGTPLEIEESELGELMGRPGAELADFARGRVKPRHQIDAMVAKRLVRSRRLDLGLRFAILNVTGRAWAYNFGNPFSGTHFGPGRTATVSLRATLR